MKRDIRKNNKEEMSMKIIKYSAITVAILTVIVFGVLIYSKKLNDTVKEGTLLGEQISTQNENTESASTEIGKSVNESENELKAQNQATDSQIEFLKFQTDEIENARISAIVWNGSQTGISTTISLYSDVFQQKGT